MSEHVKLEASDGHELDAYVAHPEGGPIAGLVVVQEIFGVNRHIRSVADGYAKDGFLAVAPALFDRYERGLELGYEGEDMQKAMSLISRLNLDHALKDTAAALEYNSFRSFMFHFPFSRLTENGFSASVPTDYGSLTDRDHDGIGSFIDERTVEVAKFRYLGIRSHQNH